MTYAGAFRRPSTGNYYLDVSMGNVDGATTVHKFGYSQNVDVADGVVDIWDGVSTDLGITKVNPYNWATSAVISQLSSSSTSDVGIEVSVTGLNALGNQITQKATLNGQSPVNLSIPLIRSYRVYVSGGTEAVGNIFLTATGSVLSSGLPTVSTDIYAIVHNHSQQTQMTPYTVPYGHSLFITHGWANLSKEITAEAIVWIFKRELGGVFRIVHTLALQTSGSSVDHRPYTVPLKLKGGTDIVYRAQVFTNSTSISAGFHGILIKD